MISEYFIITNEDLKKKHSLKTPLIEELEMIKPSSKEIEGLRFYFHLNPFSYQR